MLIEAGRENHHLFILRSGRLEVFLRLDTPQPLRVISPGEMLGEMSVIDGGAASAYIRSAGVSEVIAIHERDFWQWLAPLPGLMRKLTRLLTQRFRAVNEQAAESLTRQLQLEHLKKELATAASIQMGMLPALPLFPGHPEIESHAALLPAKMVGGDLYDAFMRDEDCALLAVGDVSGKGMPAALFMMRTLTLLRAHGNARTDPAQLLPLLNALLGENNEADMFVTLYVALLELRTGRLSLLNAGHLPPLLSRRGGPFAEVHGARGVLLGIMPSDRFSLAEIVLEPGDRILFYTDGVTEAENPAQEQFGLARTREALDRMPSAAKMRDLVDGLVQAVAGFAGEAEQSDDITVMGLKYLGA